MRVVLTALLLGDAPACPPKRIGSPRVRSTSPEAGQAQHVMALSGARTERQ